MKWGKKWLALVIAGILMVTLAACDTGTPATSQTAEKRVEQMTAPEILNKAMENVQDAKAMDATLRFESTIKAAGISMDVSGALDVLYKQEPRQAKLGARFSMPEQSLDVESYFVEEDGTMVEYTQMGPNTTWTRRHSGWEDFDIDPGQSEQMQTVKGWLLKKTKKKAIQNVGGVKTAILEAALTPQDISNLMKELDVSEDNIQGMEIPDTGEAKNTLVTFTFHINTRDWTPTKISVDMADYLRAVLEKSMESSLSQLPEGVTITEPLVSLDPCILEIEFHAWGDGVKDLSVPDEAKRDTASSTKTDKMENKTAA